MEALRLLVKRQSLVSDVGERGGDYDDGAGGDQRADNIPSDDLALPSGQVYGQAGGPRRSRQREEGAGEGENLEAAVEGDDAFGGGGLAEGDVGDGSGAAEDANPALPLPRVGGDRLEDVAAATHLKYVGPEGVGALPGDDHRRPGLVLGARGAATGAAARHIAGGGEVEGGVGVVGVLAGELVAVGVIILGVRGALEVEVGAVELRNEVGSGT